MAGKDKAESNGGSPLEQLREEAVNLVKAGAQKVADSAGEKVHELTGRLTDIAEGGGELPKIGMRVLKGESPMKAFAAEKTKGLKDNTLGKVKGMFGGGGDGGGGGGGGEAAGEGGKIGDPKTTNIVESIDIGVPLRVVYDHWSAYDRFNEFTKGVQSVDKSDDMESDWKLKIGPSNRSWKATVLEQVPNERIVWKSEGAKGTTHGAISFHELGPRLTRIVVVVEYYPSGFFEKTANLWRAQGRRLRLDLKHFARKVTLAAEEDIESWRGEIRDSEVVRDHDEVTEEEEREQEGRQDQHEDEDRDEDEDDERDEDEEDEDEEDEDEEQDDYDDEDEGADEEDEDEDEERPSKRRQKAGSRGR